MRRWWVLGCLGLIGCASTPELVKAPPVAEDLVGWAAPTAVAEEQSLPAGVLDPPEARSPQERVYAYTPGESQRIDVAIGAPFDIVLQPGEEIHNIVGGDRAPADSQDSTLRWEVQQ